jgi:DNA gyrase/topoisomerase IV subunit A
VNACLALINDPDIDIDGLMRYLPGPDFPTGAIINGRAGIVQAYRTGRGRIYVRARAEVISDEKSGRDTIIVHEIPYQLNKARLIERIAELVKEKKLEGISELRDESDKDGLRIVIELRQAARSATWCSTTSTRRRRCRTSSASTWWRWSTASRGCSTSRRSSKPSFATAARW